MNELKRLALYIITYIYYLMCPICHKGGVDSESRLRGAHWLIFSTLPGVNFINVLREAFVRADLKSAQKD